MTKNKYETRLNLGLFMLDHLCGRVSDESWEAYLRDYMKDIVNAVGRVPDPVLKFHMNQLTTYSQEEDEEWDDEVPDYIYIPEEHNLSTETLGEALYKKMEWLREWEDESDGDV